MAEINTGGGDKGGKKRSKKVSTKIDMTPMVDLAFLLITFFMMTTAFSKPVTMKVTMPKKPDPNIKPPEVKQSHAITIVLGEDNKLYWFQGVDNAATPPTVELTDYAGGIRAVLKKKRAEIGEEHFVIIIKAMEKSKYKNLVDILDEMSIAKTTRYAIVKIAAADIALIENFNNTNQ